MGGGGPGGWRGSGRGGDKEKSERVKLLVSLSRWKGLDPCLGRAIHTHGHGTREARISQPSHASLPQTVPARQVCMRVPRMGLRGKDRGSRPSYPHHRLPPSRHCWGVSARISSDVVPGGVDRRAPLSQSRLGGGSDKSTDRPSPPTFANRMKFAIFALLAAGAAAQSVNVNVCDLAACAGNVRGRARQFPAHQGSLS